MAQEFTCADCGAICWSFADGPPRTRCFNCQFVRNLELPPEQEAELRRTLSVELVDPPPSSERAES